MSALEAYRLDCTSAGASPFTLADAELIRIAELLTRCTQLPKRGDVAEVIAALRAECARLAQSVHTALQRSPHAPDGTVAGITAVLRAAVSQLEDAGALRFGSALLFLADQVLGADAGALEQGRILIQRARVARKSGDAKGAMSLYDMAEKLAERESLPEVHARAHIGFSSQARARGNLPLMTRHARAALEHALQAPEPEVLALAHRSMMLAAAAAGRLDEAVLHAWAEFSVSRGDPASELDALMNVAQAVLDYGEPSIALRAFAVALRQPLPKRVALPALGGAALAAAQIGERTVLNRIVRRIDLLTASTDHPYESLSTRAEAILALAIVEHPSVERRRLALLADAEDAGFHEIAYRMAHLSPPARHDLSATTASVALKEALAGMQAVTSTAELQHSF